MIRGPDLGAGAQRASITSLAQLARFCGLASALLTVSALARGELPAEAARAVAWYDSLGYPDADKLPYVRVATGLWTQSGNAPPENRYVEGFLIDDQPDTFTVFVNSIADFTDHFGISEPFAPLAHVRFVRETSGPAHKLVNYEIQDFRLVASSALERVRKQATTLTGLRWGRPVANRARIFAFARACLQKGHPDLGLALIDIAADIPDEQSGKVEPGTLLDALQRQIGDAVLAAAEVDFADPRLSWSDLLSPYDGFEIRFPANRRVAYALEALGLLQTMVAEDADYRPKAMEQSTAREQAADNIYQLRNLRVQSWIMHNHYPVSTAVAGGKEIITPVHRLVDLGDAAVPTLIEALDDRRFTRSMVPSFNGHAEPRVLRVGDVAQKVLEHLSGRNFFPRKGEDGKLVNGTTREQAEAWWAEKNGKGERQQLIQQTAGGDQEACEAARKLVEKYPGSAIPAIEAGIQAASHEGTRGQFVEIAGLLPGNLPLAFLRSKLGPKNGLYSRAYAAEALFAKGQPDALPAMIEAWRSVQVRLPANESDAYAEVGRVITFLAKSGSAAAVDALREEVRKAPIDVRLAVVTVFLPWPQSAGSFSIGPGVHVDADIAKLPAGEAGLAIERLLADCLKDRGPRLEMKGHYNEVSYEDPRVCDLAALVLAKRWPEKYQFVWGASSGERDAQIARMSAELHSNK